MQTKNNLLITIDYAPNRGGVARYLEGYAKKHKLEVLCPKIKAQSSLFGRDLQKNTIRRRLFWGGVPKWLPLLFWVKKYKNKYCKFTISHILPVGYAVLFWGLKYDLILHGLDIINAGKGKWKRFWAKKILNKADKIIVNSKATGELLRNVFGDLYNYEIEYPLIKPLAKPYKDLRTEYTLEDKKIILSLGRLVKRKGQDKIIKLLPRILREDQDVVFLIAGEGEYRSELEKLARDLHLEDKVLFLGEVPDAELPNLYSMCDIFVLPARPSKDNWEGFGMVCLEAAYFAKPVIVYKTGGLPEAVENNATGFVVVDDEELYTKIVQLLADENLRNELGDEGKARVEGAFMI